MRKSALLGHVCNHLAKRFNVSQRGTDILLLQVIYLADRQISVRMGQSFWSRGPSLSSTFTAKDFPSLNFLPGMEDDNYASVLQATLELTQILYTAHGVLYSSTQRTLSLVNEGDYAPYLDDFQRSAATWYASWNGIQASQKIKTTLFLMYEYTCLYVNAFSFQAVLKRASNPNTLTNSGQRLVDVFSRGLMSSPDGPYIYAAISAARRSLDLINKLSPRKVLCCLPTRYYL